MCVYVREWAGIKLSQDSPAIVVIQKEDYKKNMYTLDFTFRFQFTASECVQRYLRIIFCAVPGFLPVVLVGQFCIMTELHQPQPLAMDVENNDYLVDGAAASAIEAQAQQDTSKVVVHYQVDLPPCFHSNGKNYGMDLSMEKNRLKLTVKAWTDGQQLDIATILPTHHSGDALACWLSLPQEVQNDYEKRMAKLNDVFGKKSFIFKLLLMQDKACLKNHLKFMLLK